MIHRALLAVLIGLSGCEQAGTDATPPPRNTDASPIHDIQGTGSSSPYLDQTVVVAGIVSGDFQENDDDDRRNLGGFYLQDEFADADPATSEGVFVFDGNSPRVDVNVGDRIVVTGKVSEYFGETQIAAENVRKTGRGSIAPLDIKLPAKGTLANSDEELIADLERYEGMLIRIPQTLTISNLRNLERFGEVGLAAGGRPYQFTNFNTPDGARYAKYRNEVARRSLLLDDGQRANNVKPIAYLEDSASLRVGDSIGGLTGNLRYSRGSGGDGTQAYRLMPTANVDFESSNPRPLSPAIAGSTRIASFNTLNYFSTIDSGRSSCGPASDDGCRGADSARELERQTAKLVTALAMLDADIVGFMEIENDGGQALAAIVGTLNRQSDRNYAFVDTGLLGDDVITTGFIFDSASVELYGDFAVLDSAEDPRFDDSRNRPALAQAFRRRDDGAVLSVVVNHLKSKGSSCSADGDPNRRDGQGNCRLARLNAARALADWVADDPTDSADPDYLLIGDFNAYLKEEPLEAFADAGLVNLLAANGDEQPYSFVFNSMSGALDHAVATPGLARQVSAAIEWHINADESAAFDYNLEFGRDAGLFDPDSPIRASDHDPVVVGFDLTP
ncbi:MAG: ExeM/NucH family extracellular endonuclease [Gammaproteobacteria bacterium]|nr:ExeM/NucH family extracellular endonuclease [Gammaproteobacteria bacterium]